MDLQDSIAPLADAARVLAGARSMDDVLRRVVAAAREVTGARYGALGVVGPDGTHARFLHDGIDEDTVAAIGHLPRGHGVLGAVIRRAETIRLDTLADDPASVGFPAHHPPMAAFLGTPIRFDGAVLGNLYLSGKDDGFTDDDVQRIEVLAVMAGGAIEQARLTAELNARSVVAERDRLARDLHDGAIQRIFSAGLTVEAARARLDHDPAGADDHLERVVELLDAAVTDLRSTLVDLHAHELEALGLVEGVERLAREYERTALRFPRLEVDPDLAARLGHGAVVDLLHVVRECLSNAARHATASEVELSIVAEADGLRLEVVDDGIGFDPGATRRGRGLDNIAERAALHGGTLELDAAPGRGTRIVVTMPDVGATA